MRRGYSDDIEVLNPPHIFGINSDTSNCPLGRSFKPMFHCKT
jgi:hypothetical protein